MNSDYLWFLLIWCTVSYVVGLWQGAYLGRRTIYKLLTRQEIIALRDRVANRIKWRKK